jgi:aspartate/methionine/tyrosine aminotransferase
MAIIFLNYNNRRIMNDGRHGLRALWHDYLNDHSGQPASGVNLGQGFPDFPGPDFLKQAAIRAIQGDANQYAPGSGRPHLREAIARKMARHYGLPVDPATEVTVTAGATEAIYSTIMGLVNPGDEVILFEPYYDLTCRRCRWPAACRVFIPCGRPIGPSIRKNWPLFFQQNQVDHRQHPA